LLRSLTCRVWHMLFETV